MTIRLNPYITFKGQAREAMEFYKAVFGGDLRMNTFEEFGAADGELGKQIMHAQLETERGFVLMASDSHPSMPYNPGDNITISLSGDDAGDLHRYWEGLSDGAQITAPLTKQVWGDEFGMLVDKFGVAWMANIATDQTGATDQN